MLIQTPSERFSTPDAAGRPETNYSTKLVSIPCPDGFVVQGTLHCHCAHRKTVVIIHPATAVPERIYWPFAKYLAENGFTVVTHNYRGVGSDSSMPKTKQYRMRDWADLDAASVLAWAELNYPGSNICAVGHSFGGHAIGLYSQQYQVSAAVLVASHAGSMRLIQPAHERFRAWFLLRVFCPALVAMLGYLPGRRLGLGEDLSAGILKEWSAWTRLRNYFFDDPTLDAANRFAGYEGPLLSIGFDDDPLATPDAISLLLSYFRRAAIERHQISPTELGSKKIGHMGFFREANRATLWPTVAAWIGRQTLTSNNVVCAREDT